MTTNLFKDKPSHDATFLADTLANLRGVANLFMAGKEKEIWKDVVGFEGYYTVSNFGNIISVDRDVWSSALNRMVKINGRKRILSKNRSGYPTVILSKNGVNKNIPIHRLVAMAFIPNPENKPFVNHIDRNVANPNYLNLEWVTPKENIQHSLSLGGFSKMPKGELNARSKLKSEQVCEIKNRLKNGERPISIYKDYGVSKYAIYEIKWGRTWA